MERTPQNREDFSCSLFGICYNGVYPIDFHRVEVIVLYQKSILPITQIRTGTNIYYVTKSETKLRISALV